MGFKDVVIVPSEKHSDVLGILDKNLVNRSSSSSEISIEQLLTLVNANEIPSGSCGYIHELLESSKILLLQTPEEPRNGELETRIQKLKAEQANREYKSMTKNLGSDDRRTTSFHEDVKSVNAQIAAVINFVLTVGGSFFFTFKAVEYALPEQNIPAQVMMGVVTSTVVALADLYFLARTI